MIHAAGWLDSAWWWVVLGLALLGSTLPLGSAHKERRS